VIKSLAEAFLCKIVRTICQDWQAVRSCFSELSAIGFDFNFTSVFRKDFSLIPLTSIAGFWRCRYLWLCKCRDWECRENDKNLQQEKEKRMSKRLPINDDSSVYCAVHKSGNFNGTLISKIGNFMRSVSCSKKTKVLDGGRHFTFWSTNCCGQLFSEMKQQRKAQRSNVRPTFVWSTSSCLRFYESKCSETL